MVLAMKPIECERCGQIAEYVGNYEYLCDMHTRELIDHTTRELFEHQYTFHLSITPIEHDDRLSFELTEFED